MIKGFIHKGLERFYRTDSNSGIQAKHADKLRRILVRLEVATTPDDGETMSMHDPPHPGEMIREEIMKPLGLTVTAMAAHLGVSRKTLSKIINGHGAVTPEMAYRLSLLFKPSAESWLRQQAAYDLWHTRQRSADIHVMPIEVHTV